MKQTMFVAMALLLASCATGYKQFYTPMQGATPERIAANRAGPPSAEPLVDHSGLMGPEVVKLYGENGYAIIGYSDFQGAPNQADAGAIAQAKAVKADLVVISNPSYVGEHSTVIPITTPTSSTSYTTGSATAYGTGGTATAYGSATTTTYGHETKYVPVTMSRYEYAAAYFIKVRVRFGVGVQPLTDQQRQELQSNHGVMVTTVINGSPAFEHDILVGDLLLAVDGIPVDGVAGWSTLINRKPGQTVSVKIYRNGYFTAKDIKLNP